MKYTEEIFTALSKGEFISANNVLSLHKKFYDAIEEHFSSYEAYYKGIGFLLQAGNGYYYFARRENKVEMERKLKMAFAWIDYLSFLKAFNPIFGPGYTFRPADIEMAISSDVGLKDKARTLFSGIERHRDIVDKLVKELRDMTFIEYENEDEDRYKVLSAFSYIEELIACITISDDIADEIPE